MGVKIDGNCEGGTFRPRKAAMLLIALGPEKSARIFKHLREEEIEQLTLEIANIRTVSPQMKEKVLDEFYQVCLAQQYIAEEVLLTLNRFLKSVGQRKSH